jgi:NAD-dependent dihydropyrimidine dehydrogenase PreA subunit
MRTIIYYFSATGNSLTTARSIANNLGETDLISIPQLPQQTVKTDASRIGLVFPVHMWGVPGMVVKFINRLEVPSDAYVFAVATSGGMPLGTLKQTQRLFAERGLKLAAGFSLAIVNNCTTVAGAPPLEKQQIKIKKAEAAIERICSAIKSGKRSIHQGIPVLNWLFYKYMYQRALPKVPGMGKYYSADNNCNGCGICAKACQVRNIKIDQGKPVWSDHCEACYACLQWCPKESIQMGNKTIGRRRYHHPDVRLAEIAS